MLRSYRRRTKTAEKGQKPVRDRYDWIMLCIEGAGVVLILGTIILAIWTSRESSREMAGAMERMTQMAAALKGQRVALIDQAKASGELAEKTGLLAEAARQQAGTAAKALAQSRDLFATQQRPIIDFDEASTHSNEPITFNGEMRWNYGFTNVGFGPAYDVTIFEAISVYDGPFKETKRWGSKFQPPGTSHWSTARYFFHAGELLPDKFPNPTLHVRFQYSDSLGRKYETQICRVVSFNGIVYDCTFGGEKNTKQ